jgi:hypothetical protein
MPSRGALERAALVLAVVFAAARSPAAIAEGQQ